jgi:rhomboid protease GluP
MALEDRSNVWTLFVLACAASAFVYFFTTPETRAKYVEIALVVVAFVRTWVTHVLDETVSFRAKLRARTPWPLATPILILINVLVFAMMLFGDGSLGTPSTMISWGANIGARTTNGEWWRLVTALFVHWGFLHLLANVIGLVLVGLLVEQMVGSVTLVAIYIAAGVLSNLIQISMLPLALHSGADGAIFGVLGLFVAVAIWGFLRPSGEINIPLIVFGALGPGLGIFALYHLATLQLANSANHAALGLGLVGGMILAKDVGERLPELRPTGLVMAVVLVMCVAVARPIAGIVDVRPEIAKVIAIEEETSVKYRKAVEQFRKGNIKSEALTELINTSIRPQLEDARKRVSSLDSALQEHREMVRHANDFLRLRADSWQLRVEGLNKASTTGLREADRAEQASFDALRRLRRAHHDVNAG